ncbi:MAG: hypothetical protein KJI69_00115 [Patescibacteria group bacterium]|nr:hypothetical protein [Patescibacteria group bacterium]
MKIEILFAEDVSSERAKESLGKLNLPSEFIELPPFGDLAFFSVEVPDSDVESWKEKIKKAPLVVGVR